MARVAAIAGVVVVQTLLAAVVWAFIWAAFGELSNVLEEWGKILGTMGSGLFRPSQFGDDPLWALLYLPPLAAGICSGAFLLPLAGPLALSERPRSMRGSVIAAGFIAGGLVAGGVFALAEFMALLIRGEPGAFTETWQVWTTLAAFLAIGWVAWTTLLWRYGERMDHGAARRLLRLLFRGTLLELAVVVPAYAWARSRENCYCALSSFWGLAAGVTGLFFLTGPGAFLLWARRTGRWQSHSCPGCGYLKGPAGTGRCPECGQAWR